MIKDSMDYDFNKIYELLETNFSRDEYRSFEGQKALFDDKRYDLIKETGQDGKLKGFIAFFDINEFIFIEHFVVDMTHRNLGIGQKMLKKFCAEQKKPVLLEVECPDSEINIRRIDFYKRNGFFYNDYEYRQPPIEKGCQSIPLSIMTYPKPIINEAEFIYYRNFLYKHIYHII